MNTYEISCECGAVKLKLEGTPRVRGTCHCGDCRELLNVPFHMVNAWLPEQVTVTAGQDRLGFHQHPTLRMQRVQCGNCGETVYNTNGAGWMVVSQLLVSKCLGDIPPELRSQSHFFYDRRIIDIDDGLPKK